MRAAGEVLLVVLRGLLGADHFLDQLVGFGVQEMLSCREAETVREFYGDIGPLTPGTNGYNHGAYLCRLLELLSW